MWAGIGDDPAGLASGAAATGHARLHRWTLDPATGAVTETALDDRAGRLRRGLAAHLRLRDPRLLLLRHSATTAGVAAVFLVTARDQSPPADTERELFVGTMLLLGAWNVWYLRRGARRLHPMTFSC